MQRTAIVSLMALTLRASGVHQSPHAEFQRSPPQHLLSPFCVMASLLLCVSQ